MKFIITLISSYISYKLYLVFKEVKDASIKNKEIFVEEFKKNNYHNHSYTKENYTKIKEWAESKYPKIDYIKSQDLFYSSVLFKNSKTSLEYKKALKYKEEIKKIYLEIEYDVLRECFKKIIQIDKIIDDNFEINESEFNKNKQIFKGMSNDSFFSKKISKIVICLSSSIVVTLISIIVIILSFI